jgi:kynurenine formamidase
MIDEDGLPDELVETGARPKDTTWGLFGDQYQLGTLNFLTPARVRAAAALVKSGRRFNLNLPLDEPPRGTDGDPRGRYSHRYENVGGQTDDIIDNLGTQTSTQWDGLGHVRHPRLGYYNGVDPSEVQPGKKSKLSIGAWAEAGGLVGRGVLLDLPRYFEAQHTPYEVGERLTIDTATVDSILRWEALDISPGDILLIRTGAITQQRAGGRLDGMPGLGPGREMGAYLWRKRVAAVASDTSAFEPFPIDTGGARSMHMQLLPMLGMPIGELFYLEELAEECSRDGVYEFMVVSVPLNLPGGVASPPNAIAIK